MKYSDQKDEKQTDLVELCFSFRLKLQTSVLRRARSLDSREKVSEVEGGGRNRRSVPTPPPLWMAPRVYKRRRDVSSKQTRLRGRKAESRFKSLSEVAVFAVFLCSAVRDLCSDR